MKIRIFFISLLLVLFLPSCIVFGDDSDLETNPDISSIVNASSDIITAPIINSRAAIIYDRSSGSILYGKAENEKKKMA